MDRKGSVSVWICCMMPMVILCLALLIEVGNWQTQKDKLQRVADVASIGGLLEYDKDRPPHNSEPIARSKAEQAASLLVQINTLINTPCKDSDARLANPQCMELLGLEPETVFTPGENATMSVRILDSIPMIFVAWRLPMVIDVTSKAKLMNCGDYVVNPCVAGETTRVGLVQ